MDTTPSADRPKGTLTSENDPDQSLTPDCRLVTHFVIDPTKSDFYAMDCYRQVAR